MEVSHINQQRIRKTRSESNCFATWPIGDLVPKSAREWLAEAMSDSEMSDMAVSLWVHHPNLRAATEKLSAYITPYWPCENGESLLKRSVETAVNNVQLATRQGDTYAPRLIALYLSGLASCVQDVLRIGVYGCSKSGDMEFWDYFSEPIHDWGVRFGMTELEAHISRQELRTEEILGMRYHLITRISTAIDTGYFQMFAPPVAGRG